MAEHHMTQCMQDGALSKSRPTRLTMVEGHTLRKAQQGVCYCPQEKNRIIPSIPNLSLMSTSSRLTRAVTARFSIDSTVEPLSLVIPTTAKPSSAHFCTGAGSKGFLTPESTSL